MVALRNFTDDVFVLQKNQYQSMESKEIQKMISEWNKKEFQDKYFEMFAIINNSIVVGSISLYQHSKSVISFGVDVFEGYRKCGFGKEAMRLAMDNAKRQEYKIVSQQIRTNNIASIALHQSLGFETNDYTYINKRGNEVVIYLKSLL